MDASTDKPGRYRERAAEARAEAEKMANEEFKQTLLNVAESYERLAYRIEQKESQRARRNSD
jgi:molecular chaperone GrpE (heat shock protein)